MPGPGTDDAFDEVRRHNIAQRDTEVSEEIERARDIAEAAATGTDDHGQHEAAGDEAAVDHEEHGKHEV